MAEDDPWKKQDPFDPARLADQQAGLDDYLKREAEMTPEQKAKEDLDQFAMRNSNTKWGCILAIVLAIFSAFGAWFLHGN
jgi:hypothetical protein